MLVEERANAIRGSRGVAASSGHRRQPRSRRRPNGASCDPTAAHESPSPVPHAPRGGVVFSAATGSPVNPTEVPLERRRGRTGDTPSPRRSRTIRPRSRRHQRASADARDRRDSSRPESKPESWPELREIQGGRLSEIPADALRQRVRARVSRSDPERLRGSSAGSRSASSSIG